MFREFEGGIVSNFTLKLPIQRPEWLLTNYLDDCTKENGALHVIKNSHQMGVVEVKNEIDHLKNKEMICEVDKGGILLMKPLILHASRRTENNKNRRVIHLEFCQKTLPKNLFWKEGLQICKFLHRIIT